MAEAAITSYIDRLLTNGADTATIHQLISTIEGEMARLEEALRAQ